jgi:hypothetical protein
MRRADGVRLSACRASNEAGEKFCGECGIALVRSDLKDAKSLLDELSN